MEISDDTARKVLLKLVYGELVDEEYTIEPENLDRIIYLLGKYEFANEDLAKVLDKVIEENNHDALKALVNILNLDFLSNYIHKSSSGYLPVFSRIFTESPASLSKDQLILALDNPGIDENLHSAILHYITSNELDLDKSPESLLLRIKLISIHGIVQNDLEKASEKFHIYQSRDKFGLELVQTELLKAYAYQAVNQDKQIFAKIAETLLPSEIPVKVLQLLMISQSAFDAESALKWYNDYIQKVSKKINEHTKRSATGLLTESLLVSNLYDNDRNFATLVFDKAIENGIISDQDEIAHIKKVFKVYGEAFTDDEDWRNAKPIFKRYILEYIKRC